MLPLKWLVVVENIIREEIKQSIETKQRLLFTLSNEIARAGNLLAKALRSGKKVILFGNGGSAADAQHIAAELVGRFKKERKAIPAMALTTNTSTLTAIGNDYSYEEIFSRQVEAFAQKGDVVIGISTSGNSPNVLKAMKQAKKLGAATVALCGAGGKLKGMADVKLCVPSTNTPRIQECHILVGHILCKIAEENLLREKRK